jgi:methylenetetrahydrofolate dehydrogenase (NADP+) / methenyltetrahydrofolate cyclohydrolase
MAATLMYGKPLAERIRAEVAEDVRRLGHVGLATVLVGDDAASQIYIRSKHRAAVAVGIDARDVRLPADTPADDVVGQVDALVADDEIDAVLVQLPLPDHIDEERVLAAIDPIKDVDGLHPFNAGHLYLGRPTIVPATPLGVMVLLEDHGVPLESARAVVVGRSELVGKPAAQLLLQANASVSICHSRTDDLAHYTRDADVLVVAVGRAGLVTADMVKPGAAVVDVGINRTEAGLVGDVDPKAGEVAGRFTPVPGGVGPMTIALLLRNAVRCAKYRRGDFVFPAR